MLCVLTPAFVIFSPVYVLSYLSVTNGFERSNPFQRCPLGVARGYNTFAWYGEPSASMFEGRNMQTPLLPKLRPRGRLSGSEQRNTRSQVARNTGSEMDGTVGVIR